MILGSAEFQALEKSWEALFHDTLAEDPLGTIGLLESLSMTNPSTGSSEDYTDFEVDVTLREWIGERAMGTAEAKVINVKNKTYEASIGVKREDIEDDRTGIYEPRIMGLADAYNRGRKRDGLAMLTGGNAINIDAPTFDDVAFFSASHAVGGVAPATQSNITVGALDVAALAAARKTMRQLVNHLGEPLEIEPNLLIVGPELEATCEAIFKKEYLSGGESNLDYQRIPYRVVNSLGSSNRWFLVDTTKALKPLIWQPRREPKFEKLTTGSAYTMFTNRFFYGTSARYAYGYGAWQTIHGGFPA